MKSYKNSMLIGILERAIDSMCLGMGTRKVKTFLNSAIKSGDDVAYLLRELLECETLNINAKRYNNTMGFDYRESYYSKKSERLSKLLYSLVKSNPCNVVFGYAESDVLDTAYIIYFEHPLFGQISFHCDIDRELLSQLKKFEGEWDGLVNSTMDKLEKAIESQYGEVLDEKYKDVRDEYHERNRLAQIHKENVNKIRKLLDEDFANVYKFDDYSKSECNDAFCGYDNKDELTKFILEGLGFDTSDYLINDEVISKINSGDKKYLLKFISFGFLKRVRKSFLNKKAGKIISFLSKDLNNVFELSEYPLEFIVKAANQMSATMKKDLILKIIDKYGDGCNFESNPRKFHNIITQKFIEGGKDYLSQFFAYEKIGENFDQLYGSKCRNMLNRLRKSGYNFDVLEPRELESLYNMYRMPGSKVVFTKGVRKRVIPELRSMFENKESN